MTDEERIALFVEEESRRSWFERQCDCDDHGGYVFFCLAVIVFCAIGIIQGWMSGWDLLSGSLDNWR